MTWDDTMNDLHDRFDRIELKLDELRVVITTHRDEEVQRLTKVEQYAKTTRAYLSGLLSVVMLFVGQAVYTYFR